MFAKTMQFLPSQKIAFLKNLQIIRAKRECVPRHMIFIDDLREKSIHFILK